jgi:hypothetical protein
MFTAIIYQNSPQLPKMRALLSKQCLQWDEESAPDASMIINGVEWVIPCHPAVKITVSDTRHKVKATRAKPKPRKHAANDPYKSEMVSEGVHLWKTPSGVLTASFGYDAKAQERIKKEARADIDKRLRAKSDFLTYKE